MSIIFGHFASAAISDADLAYKRAESLAKGETVHAITAAELDAMSEHEEYDMVTTTIVRTIWPKVLQGHLIELKPGAYTEAQVEDIKNGALTLLDAHHYGKKWRVWIGWPTDEQKAATPWEEDGGHE